MSEHETIDHDTGEVLVPASEDLGQGGAGTEGAGALVPVGPTNLLGITEPDAYLEHVQRIANQLVQIVDQQQLYTMIGGSKHIEVKAWTYLGSMLGVFASIVDEPSFVKGREGSGGGWKATAEARTLGGALVGRATALCMRDERNWRDADEHDVMAMAQTRAIRNALRHPLGFIVQMAGFEIPEDKPRSSEANARFHALLSDLAAADTTISAVEHRLEIKRWGTERGYPPSTKDWSGEQMSAAMEELERRIETAGIPF